MCLENNNVLENNKLHGGVLIKSGLLVGGLACFLGFSWAVKAHFRSIGPMPPGMRAVSLLTVCGFLWFVFRLLAGRQTGLWVAGMGCFVLSLAIFIWAVQCTRKTPPTLAFSPDEPSFLLHHGPYQYVRHPFYLSYLLFWTGTAVSTPGLLPWAAPALMLLIYFSAARREERKFAHSGLAKAYRQYRTKVGMFLPHFGSCVTFN